MALASIQTSTREALTFYNVILRHCVESIQCFVWHLDMYKLNYWSALPDKGKEDKQRHLLEKLQERILRDFAESRVKN